MDVEAGSYEHEAEYDRLQTSVSWERAEAYARRLHSHQGHHANTPKLRHCYAVAELAARHSRALFADVDFFAQRYRETICRAGGLLHEAFDSGGVFEDVVAAADEAVARLVGDVSADRRLPWPKRIKVYGNQLGLASAAAQIVKFADLQHDCLLLKDAQTDAAVVWATEAREILASLGRMQSVSSPALAAQVRQLKVDLQSVDKRKRTRRK